MPEEKSATDCSDHAGQLNDGNRSELDHVMRTIPENQSGVGRHKCPYCAYNRGYRKAMQDVADWTQRQPPKGPPSPLQ